MAMAGNSIVNLEPDFLASAGNVSPAIAANPKQTIFSLQPGRDGVFQTAEMMAACVRGEVGPDHNGFQSPAVAKLGREIESIFYGQSFPQAVFNYAQFCLSYVEHPFDLQVVQDCIATAEQGSGDCVSFSVFIATLLASRKIPVCFVFQDVTGEEYTHVYCEALINHKLIALDAVSKEAMGWRQPLQATGFETTWIF